MNKNKLEIKINYFKPVLQNGKKIITLRFSLFNEKKIFFRYGFSVYNEKISYWVTL